MLFFIGIIILVVGVIWGRHDWASFGAEVCTAVGVVATAIMLIVLLVNYIGVSAYVDQMNTRYEMLTYQYENAFYENDNDVGKYELVSKIQDWNEDLSRNKRLQRDVWVGIFVPNIYDQFDYINL